MARATSSAPSQRMLRVGEQVRAAITQVLQRGEVRDDLMEKHRDLGFRSAHVAGPEDRHRLCDAARRRRTTISVIDALESSMRNIIRGRLGGQLLRQMKYMPEVRFRDDTSFDNYKKIDAAAALAPRSRRDLDAPATPKTDTDKR
jgi:ribosome-binding factor A